MRKFTIGSISALVALGIATLALVPAASAGTDRQASATATTVQVKGGEFFFKLSTKSIARPGKVTFLFKKAGHVAHDFKINPRKNPVIGPGKTGRLIGMFNEKGQ